MATINFNDVPVDANLSVDHINFLAAQSTEVATAFAGKIASLQNNVDDARQRYGRDAEELVSGSDSSSRAVAKKFARQQLAQRIMKFHRTIVASSEVDREPLLSVLAGYAKEAAFLETLCASPTQILGRVGLGDAKRTQYQTQLDGAGPVELETAALTAVATNDLVLAAAIVTVLDRRPVDRRPFSANDLAARLFGAEYKKVSTQLAGIQIALKTAIAVNREFVRGKADPLTNLSNQLAARAIAEARDEG